MFKLIKPSKEYQDDIKRYKDEMLKEGVDHLEGCGGLENYENFEKWMNHLNSYADRNTIDPASGYVEGSQYMLVNDENHRVLGMINLRHYLNETLYNTSGHVGYSVRPSERRKGYGKMMLKEALKILKSKGVSDVLITCDTYNVASYRTMEACGGKFEKEVYVDEFKSMVKRYWIHI